MNAPFGYIYLVIQSSGIAYAGPDFVVANRIAKNTGGIVCHCPIVTDYRKDGKW